MAEHPPVIGWPQWFAIDAKGLITSCADEADARASAAEFDAQYPHRAPYTALALAPVGHPAALPAGWVALPKALPWEMQRAVELNFRIKTDDDKELSLSREDVMAIWQLLLASAPQLPTMGDR